MKNRKISREWQIVDSLICMSEVVVGIVRVYKYSTVFHTNFKSVDWEKVILYFI